MIENAQFIPVACFHFLRFLFATSRIEKSEIPQPGFASLLLEIMWLPDPEVSTERGEHMLRCWVSTCSTTCCQYSTHQYCTLMRETWHMAEAVPILFQMATIWIVIWIITVGDVVKGNYIIHLDLCFWAAKEVNSVQSIWDCHTLVS